MQTECKESLLEERKENKHITKSILNVQKIMNEGEEGKTNL